MRNSKTCAEIIHTLCLPESAIAALSSVNVPFIAIFFYCNGSGVIKAGRRMAHSPIIAVRDHIFDEGIGPNTPCQIGDDDADAGGDHSAIDDIDDDMVVLILHDRFPRLRQVFGHFRHAFFVEMGVQGQ